MGQRDRGLYGKFIIQRTDGTDLTEGDKHYGCEYFVLDLTHDQHSIPALLGYIASCEKDGYDALAEDLKAKIMAVELQRGASIIQALKDRKVELEKKRDESGKFNTPLWVKWDMQVHCMDEAIHLAEMSLRCDFGKSED